MTGRQVVEGAARDLVRGAMIWSLQRSGDLGAQLLSSRTLTDPYPLYDRIREASPIVDSKLGPITADRQVIEEIFRHPEVGTATAAEFKKEGALGALMFWMFDRGRPPEIVQPISTDSMIGLDAPDHTRLRKLVTKVFTPRSIRALRPRLTEIAHDLLDQAVVRPDFDLMRDFARSFPVLAICEILGIPGEDRARFARWGNLVAADLEFGTPARQARAATRSMIELNDYFAALFAERRRNPGDDLISELLTVSDDGDTLSARELMATCLLLLVAGFETTVNLLGNGTLALLRNPDQLAALRADPGLIPGAVEELLRFDAPVQMTARVPLSPIQVAGVPLSPDQEVTLILGGANRDPAVFSDPHTLDATRPNAKEHLAFASGPHYCLGAHLARTEAEIGFTALLERFDHLEPAGHARRRRTTVLRGLDSLPLKAGALVSA